MNTGTPSTPTVDDTIAHIAQQYGSLSRQLKKIALYVEKHRDELGLDGVREFAKECNVHPSAVVRFAQHFGFEGFREMQTMFRGNLTRKLTAGNYVTERMRVGNVNGRLEPSNVEIAQEFMAGSVAGLQALEQGLSDAAFQTAVELLSHSDCVLIAASRLSFPVAAYLDYALQHTDKRVITIQTLANTHLGQSHTMRSDDVMVAISFFPYAEETLAVARNARDRGVKVIAMTDSGMSPLARIADTYLLVQENSHNGFRSLTSSLALAQCLFIAMGQSQVSSPDAGTPAMRFQSNEAFAQIRECASY